MSAPSVVGRAPSVPFGVGLRAGMTIASTRLRSRPFAFSLGLALAFALAAAFVARRAGSSGSVDRALGVVFSYVVPLSTLATTALVMRRSALRDVVWPVARFGVARQSVALGVTFANALACAASVMFLALVTIVFAHGPSSGALAHDLMTTGWIALLTGAAYGAWFSLGSALGKRGGGRVVVLALDFVLGKLGLLGALFPRIHAESLLGLEASAALSQPASSVMLATITFVVSGLVYLKTRD